MPAVSVILPTRNRCDMLREAVRSVLSQTCDDWELVIIDDGSKDNTASVVSSFTDSRITSLHTEHGGRSRARNLGLREVRSDWIAFLDDDDLFLPGKLEQQLDFLRHNPEVDLLSCGARYIDADDMFLGNWIPWLRSSPISFHDALYHVRILPSACLFRRQLLESMDHWFDPDIVIVEDTDFFVRMLLAGARPGVLHRFVSCYRLHDGNSPGSLQLFGEDYVRVLDKVFRYPNLPAEVIADRNRIYAHTYIMSAFRLYDAGDTATARRDLERAHELDAAYTESNFTSLLAKSVTLPWCDPRAFFDSVFLHLPERLSELAGQRKDAYRLWLRRSLEKHAAGEKLVGENELCCPYCL